MLISNTAFKGIFRFQDIKGDLSDNIKIFSRIIFSCPTFIFTKSHIQEPVQIIFYTPMSSLVSHYLFGRQSLTAVNKIMILFGLFTVFFNCTIDYPYSFHIFPFVFASKPADILRYHTYPCFNSAMSFFYGFMI